MDGNQKGQDTPPSLLLPLIHFDRLLHGETTVMTNAQLRKDLTLGKTVYEMPNDSPTKSFKYPGNIHMCGAGQVRAVWDSLLLMYGLEDAAQVFIQARKGYRAASHGSDANKHHLISAVVATAFLRRSIHEYTNPFGDFLLKAEGFGTFKRNIFDPQFSSILNQLPSFKKLGQYFKDIMQYYSTRSRQDGWYRRNGINNETIVDEIFVSQES